MSHLNQVLMYKFILIPLELKAVNMAVKRILVLLKSQYHLMMIIFNLIPIYPTIYKNDICFIYIKLIKILFDIIYLFIYNFFL
jgi:hypothetical protein